MRFKTKGHGARLYLGYIKHSCNQYTGTATAEEPGMYCKLWDKEANEWVERYVPLEPSDVVRDSNGFIHPPRSGDMIQVLIVDEGSPNELVLWRCTPLKVGDAVLARLRRSFPGWDS